MLGRRSVLVPALLLLALTGCSSDGGVAGRLADGAVGSLDTALASLTRSTGGQLVLGSVQLVDPVTLADLNGAKPEAQVAFSLQTPSGPTSMIAVAVARENGSLVLCGEMQEGAPGVQGQIAGATFPPFIGRLDTLQAAIPTEVASGATQVDDRQLTDLGDVQGASDGWTRAWAMPDGTGVRITAYRTGGTEEATVVSRAALAAAGLDAVEYLGDLHGGFVGVTEVQDAWTWVHPASVGGLTQRASAVVGDIATVVEITGVDAAADTDQLNAILDRFGYG
ncbi:MAG: hypothetical protein ACOYMR_16115 [Ilumatobacteraceae bacterium]